MGLVHFDHYSNGDHEMESAGRVRLCACLAAPIGDPKRV